MSLANEATVAFRRGKECANVRFQALGCEEWGHRDKLVPGSDNLNNFTVPVAFCVE